MLPAVDRLRPIPSQTPSCDLGVALACFASHETGATVDCVVLNEHSSESTKKPSWLPD